MNERGSTVPPGLMPEDHALPRGAVALLGPAAGDVLADFLGPRGSTLQAWRPVQVMYRPGSSCLVRYRATALRSDGSRRALSLCVEERAEPRTFRLPSPEFEARYGLPDPVEFRDDRLVWAFPYDPSLRELEQLLWPASLRTLLSEVGSRPRTVRITPVRYRPGRRAVLHLRMRHGGGDPPAERYAKVLRRSRAARLDEIATHLAAGDEARRPWRRSRAPAIRFALPDGALTRSTALFAPATGTTLSALLAEGGSLPDPERIADVLDRIRSLDPALAAVPAARHRTCPAEVARTTADLLHRLVPDHATAVEVVVDAVARGVHDHVGVAPGLVHGDLYEGQILVADDRSLTLVDLEEMGLGDPALDAANMTAHLLAYALASPEARDRLRAYRLVVRDAFLRRLELSPEAFAWREALVLLQLATGPFRVLSPRWPDRVRQGVRLAARVATTSG
jgi:hypothetical protein